MRKKSRKLRSLLSSLVILALITMMIPAGVFAEEEAAVPTVAADEALGGGEADSLDAVQSISGGTGFFQGKLYSVIPAPALGMNFTQAKAAASLVSLSAGGIDVKAGEFRLVSVNTAEELAFVETLVASKIATPTNLVATGTDFWTGAIYEGNWYWPEGPAVNPNIPGIDPAIGSDTTGDGLVFDSAAMSMSKKMIKAHSANTDTSIAGYIIEQATPATVPGNLQVKILDATNANPITTLGLNANGNSTINLNVWPSQTAYNYSALDFIWESSNTNIVTVTRTTTGAANLFGVAPGTATITGSIAGTNLTASLEVNVGTAADSFKIVKANTTTEVAKPTFLSKGQTQGWAVQLNPQGAVNPGFTWTSAYPNIATVDANGLVTAVAVGDTTITVKSTNSIIGEQKINIKVLDQASQTTGVVNNKEYRLYDEANLTWTQAQTLATNLGGHLVTITSEAEQTLVASLAAKGGLSTYWMGGTTTIDTVKQTATGKWEVTPAEAFTYTNWGGQYQPSLTLGETSMRMAKADGKWSTAAGTGTKTNGYIVEYDVAVIPVTEITLDQTALDFDLAKSPEPVQLKATFAPENANNTDKIEWYSSNPSVASVDKTGLVTAGIPGTAIITARVNGVTATCTVNVNSPVTASYRSHVADKGWLAYTPQADINGTTGEFLRMEAFQVELVNAPAGLGLEYKSHIENRGWEKDFIQSPDITGTYGAALRLEAIEMKLTGPAELTSKYNVYYQVHAQNFGWLPWAKDGAKSGTAGYAYQLEAIRVAIIPVGDPVPEALPPVNASTTEPFQVGPLNTM